MSQPREKQEHKRAPDFRHRTYDPYIQTCGDGHITTGLYFSSFYQIKTTSHPSPTKTFDITGPLPYNPIIKGALPKTLTDWSGFYEMQLFSW